MRKLSLFTLLFFCLLFTYGQREEIDSLAISAQLEKQGLALIKRGKYLSALPKLKQAISNSPISYNDRRIQLYYDLGYSLQNARDIDSARVSYKTGDRLINSNTSDSILAKKYLNMASLSYAKQNIDSSMSYAIKSLELSLNTNNSKLKSTTHLNIAALFLYQKNFNKAKEYIQLATQYAEESNDSTKIMASKHYEGQLYFEEKKLDLAHSTLNDVIHFFEPKNDLKQVFVAKGYLTKVLLAQKKNAEFFKISQEFIPLINEFEFIGKAKKIVENTNEIVKMSQNEQLPADSVKKAIELTEENISLTPPSPVTIEQNEAILSYIEQGKTDSINNKSVSYEEGTLAEKLRRTVREQDSLYQLALEGKYIELEAKYKNQQNENKILQLQQKETQQQLQIAKEKEKKLLYALISAIVFLGFISLLLYAKNRKKQLTQENVAHIIQAREFEKTEIAKKIHDDNGKRLELVAVTLQNDEKIKLSKEVMSIKDELRVLSKELQTVPFEESPFDAQIFTLASQYQTKKLAIKINGLKKIHWSPIPDAIKRNLYLVIREGFSNVYNHAKATEVRIDFEQRKNELQLSLNDNGIGFEANDIAQSIGMRNMKVRINEINGKIKFQSSPQKGTSVFINIEIA